MDHLKLLEAGLRAFDARLPDVTPALCVSTRYKSSSCRACLDVCPVGALVASPWLELDAAACRACGACAAVCRTGALDCDLRSRAFRAECHSAATGELSLLTVCCREADSELAGGAACVLPCLGGLAASDLLAAAALGVERVDLISGECEACPERVAEAALDLAVSTARETLVALRGCLDVTRSRRPGQCSAATAAVPAVSRRELFRYLARGVGRAAADGAAPAHPERSIGTLHRHVAAPGSHRRLILDLSELQSGDDSAVTLPVSLPLAGIVATSACDACGLCVNYCPHGALVIEEDSVSAHAHRCTGCGLCVEVCPRSALHMGPAVLSPGRPHESEPVVPATASA